MMNDGLKKELLNLCGGSVEIRANDIPDEFGQASISILFPNDITLNACYWRMIKVNNTVISSFDHKQIYGLDEPIDAKEMLIKILDNQILDKAELDRKSGDLHFLFSNGTSFQVFGFSAYEVWELHYSDGSTDYSNHL
ncbi:MAG: hypothetical protein ABJN40_10740 [Sneathiella sp.]